MYSVRFVLYRKILVSTLMTHIVNGRTDSSGTSVWLRRRNAIRAALEQACYKLGLVDGPLPEQTAFLIDISDDEDALPGSAEGDERAQDTFGTHEESVVLNTDTQGESSIDSFPRPSEHFV